MKAEILILLAARLAARATGALVVKGVVFGGDEWSAPTAGYGTTGAAASLAALAATGATHVRVLVTQYQTYVNSTAIYPIVGASPLASSTLEQVRTTVRAAHALNLSVLLAPILDPSWDVATNGRSIDPRPESPPVSRLEIGSNFTEGEWADWFASYAGYVLPLAALAASERVAAFEIASELDVALVERAPQWRALIAAVRAGGFAGALHVAANAGTVAQITFWDALDAIGVDAYYGLGPAALPLGVAPTVDELIAAWAPVASSLAALSASVGKPVLFTEVGYQSRPSCHVRPWGTAVHDPLDDSAWLEDHDMACQANAYEALFRVFADAPWWAGVYWWLWKADPTSGGTGDTDFTPHGKPAEAVLRRWYGAPEPPACAAGFYAAHTFMADGAGMPAAWPALAADGSDGACDGSGAVADAVRAAAAPQGASPTSPGTRRGFDGYQWSAAHA